MTNDPTTPLSVTVDHACRLVGLGRTSLYALMDAGIIESTTVGRRRLVLYRSLLALVDARPAPETAPDGGESRHE